MDETALAEDLLAGLARRELLVMSGKGGVGRTTVAALFGLALARRGKKVLLASTGLDDRLAWMLDAPRLETRARELTPGLWVQRLCPEVCVREYGGLTLRSETLAAKIFGNDTVRRFLAAVPGLDDFAVLGKVWHEAARAGTYDVVILDGPATGHLALTLGVPAAILRTVPEGPLTREASAMVECLQDPNRAQAVLVGLPELWPLTELGELAALLREEIGLAVGALVINGLWESQDLAPLADAQLAPGDTMAPRLARLAAVGAIGVRQERALEDWRQGAGAALCAETPLLRLPWRWEAVGGLSDTHALLGSMGLGRSHP